MYWSAGKGDPPGPLSGFKMTVKCCSGFEVTLYQLVSVCNEAQVVFVAEE
jgi:hypothetical protein